MNKPYIVGNRLYCVEVGAYATFAEALEHYERLPKPTRYEICVIGICNADECDNESSGLTDEELEQL